ncbi:hypothetical protein DOY81_010762, partial [Sarcophaga bullata]
QTLQTYLQEAENLVDQKLALEEQLSEKQQKIEELLKELKCHKEKQGQLEQEMDKIDKERIDPDHIEKLKAENSDLQQQLEALEKELQTFKESSNANKENC